MGYCLPSDVYRQIPPGSLPNPGRLVSSISTTADTLTLANHGLADDDEVTLRADAGGSLPGSLSAGTTYYAIVVSDSVIQLAASAGGAALDITSGGSNVVLVKALPLAEWIEDETAIAEQVIPAHCVPVDSTDIANVPRVLRDYVAKRVAMRGLISTGGSTEDIERQLQGAQIMLDRWVKGVPIRGAVVPQASNLAVRASQNAVDVRGWDRGDRNRIP